MNVGQHTTLGNGDVSQKLVQLFIVPDGELEMTGNDTGLLVVAGSVASQLKNFGSEILEDSSQVDGSASTNALSVVALPQKTVDTTNRERETSLGRTATSRVSIKHVKIGDVEHLRLRVLGARGLAARLAAASHFECGIGGLVLWVSDISERSRVETTDVWRVSWVDDN